MNGMRIGAMLRLGGRRAHASASQPETAPAKSTSRALGENAAALPLPTLDAVGFSEPPEKPYDQHRALERTSLQNSLVTVVAVPEARGSFVAAADAVGSVVGVPAMVVVPPFGVADRGVPEEDTAVEEPEEAEVDEGDVSTDEEGACQIRHNNGKGSGHALTG